MAYCTKAILLEEWSEESIEKLDLNNVAENNLSAFVNSTVQDSTFSPNTNNRAKKSLPKKLILKPTNATHNNSTDMGVWAQKLIPKGTRFGPIVGEIKIILTENMNKAFIWNVFPKSPNQIPFIIYVEDVLKSNWIRYVQFAENKEAQNLLVYQDGNDIFFLAMRDIQKDEELYVWYCKEFAARVHKPESPPCGALSPRENGIKISDKQLKEGSDFTDKKEVVDVYAKAFYANTKASQKDKKASDVDTKGSDVDTKAYDIVTKAAYIDTEDMLPKGSAKESVLNMLIALERMEMCEKSEICCGLKLNTEKEATDEKIELVENVDLDDSQANESSLLRHKNYYEEVKRNIDEEVKRESDIIAHSIKMNSYRQEIDGLQQSNREKDNMIKGKVEELNKCCKLSSIDCQNVNAVYEQEIKALQKSGNEKDALFNKLDSKQKDDLTCHVLGTNVENGYSGHQVNEVKKERKSVKSPKPYCARASCPYKGRHRCSRCKAVFYCHEDCLTQDWPHHKTFCDYVYEANKCLHDSTEKDSPEIEDRGEEVD